MKYKILQDCYYGEKGQRHRFLTAGTIYSSETLKPENAPKYFKLIEEKKEVKSVEQSSSGMSYNEMKKFVKDNDIEVADTKKETLEIAIVGFLALKADLAKQEAKVEEEGQKQALELKQNPAPAGEEGESPIVNGDDNEE